MKTVKIKGYSNYTISENGIITNTVRDEVLAGSINGSGYHQYRLTNDLGFCVTWGIHRLLVWAFQTNFGDINGLVVNHLDGDKLNNALDNLELTTYSGNSEHAGLHGLTEKCKPVLVRNILTGAVVKYPSVIKAAIAQGLSKDVVSSRCHRSDRVYPCGHQYKFGWDDFTQSVKEMPYHKYINDGNKEGIIARDVITGKVREFSSNASAAKYYRVSPATISKFSTDCKQPVMTGLVQLKKITDCSDWIDHLDPILNYEKSCKVKCIWTWTDNAERVLHTKARDAALHLKISTTSLDYRLKSKGVTKFKDGTYCCYYADTGLPFEETLKG